MMAHASRLFVLLMVLFLPVAAWAGGPYWIDVRSAEEYGSGHVPQAVNIPHTEITQRIGEVTADPDALIYVYCRSGRRSGFAREALESIGYANVINLGGLEDAQRASVKLESCTKADPADC